MIRNKHMLLASIVLFAGLIEAAPLTREQLKGLIVDDNGADLIQVSAPSQGSMANGGTSCGYQAVFNGLALRSIFLASDADRPAAIAYLGDAQARHDVFCDSESPWRQAVRLYRAQQDAKVSLEEQIGLSFKNALLADSSHRQAGKAYRSLLNEKTLEHPAHQNQKLWDALWYECRNVAYEISIAHANVNNGSLTYTVSADEIKQTFITRMKKRIADEKTEHKDRYEFFNSEARLAEYIDFKDASVDTPLHDAGNWIDALEVERLFRDHQKADMSSTFILGSNLGTDTPLENDQLTTSVEFKNFVAEFQKDGGTKTGIFVIYIGALSSSPEKDASHYSNKDAMAKGTAANSNGHWFTVVAHKEGTVRQVVPVDSLGNPSRIDHYRVKEVRSLLLGQDYVQDGSFAQWIDEARPASVKKILNKIRTGSSEFTLNNPFATGLIIGFVATALSYYVMQTYTNKTQKALYRSPGNLVEHDIAISAVY